MKLWCLIVYQVYGRTYLNKLSVQYSFYKFHQDSSIVPFCLFSSFHHVILTRNISGLRLSSSSILCAALLLMQLLLTLLLKLLKPTPPPCPAIQVSTFICLWSRWMSSSVTVVQGPQRGLSTGTTWALIFLNEVVT